MRGSFRTDPAAEQKRQYVRELFDEIDILKIEESLDATLAMTLPIEPWRRAVIETPEIIAYCQNRKVRWHDDGNIYLLRKIRTSGEHAELFTYYLKTGLLTQKYQNGQLAPFGAPQYHSANGESETPSACLEWRRSTDTVALNFTNENDSYRITVRNGIGGGQDDVETMLMSSASFQVGEHGVLYRLVAKADIGPAIEEIVLLAALHLKNNP